MIINNQERRAPENAYEGSLIKKLAESPDGNHFKNMEEVKQESRYQCSNQGLRNPNKNENFGVKYWGDVPIRSFLRNRGPGYSLRANHRPPGSLTIDKKENTPKSGANELIKFMAYLRPQ